MRRVCMDCENNLVPPFKCGNCGAAAHDLEDLGPTEGGRKIRCCICTTEFDSGTCPTTAGLCRRCKYKRKLEMGRTTPMRKAIAVVVLVTVAIAMSAAPAGAKPLHFVKTKKFWFAVGAVAAGAAVGGLIAHDQNNVPTYSGAPYRVYPNADVKAPKAK